MTAIFDLLSYLALGLLIIPGLLQFFGTAFEGLF